MSSSSQTRHAPQPVRRKMSSAPPSLPTILGRLTFRFVRSPNSTHRPILIHPPRITTPLFQSTSSTSPQLSVSFVSLVRISHLTLSLIGSFLALYFLVPPPYVVLTFSVTLVLPFTILSTAQHPYNISSLARGEIYLSNFSYHVINTYDTPLHFVHSHLISRFVSSSKNHPSSHHTDPKYLNHSTSYPHSRYTSP